MNRLYSAAPDGYCGDEDNGQTSAWYVFSALGFYPVCPASDRYAVGSPYFRKAVIYLENGRKVEINAHDNGKGRPYVRSLKVNGRPAQGNFLKHIDLVNGAGIDFTMSDEPLL